MLLLGRPALAAAELQRRQPVPVPAGVDVRRPGIQTGPHNHPELAVGLDALSDELRRRLHDKIALDPLPHEMKLVVIAPHVGA